MTHPFWVGVDPFGWVWTHLSECGPFCVGVDPFGWAWQRMGPDAAARHPQSAAYV